MGHQGSSRVPKTFGWISPRIALKSSHLGSTGTGLFKAYMLIVLDKLDNGRRVGGNDLYLIAEYTISDSLFICQAMEFLVAAMITQRRDITCS